MSEKTLVQCPTCRADVSWIDSNTHRPFCSRRCQQIDFGDWATESFSIAGEPTLDQDLMDSGEESSPTPLE